MIRMNVALACAAALWAAGLSLPASAVESDAGQAAAASSADTAESANAADRTEVPTPKARPAPVRKRVAAAAPVRHVSRPHPPYWSYRHYERVAAQWWPVLFVGVGY